ncbi:hypothetical protein LINGRAHAP2_LOCUS24227 [Linum grandiflorum]
MEPSMTEKSFSHISSVQNGDSECGTELSVTSTLDSPDVSVVEAAEPEQKRVKALEEETFGLSKLKSDGEEFEYALEDPFLVLLILSSVSLRNSMVSRLKLLPTQSHQLKEVFPWHTSHLQRDILVEAI